MFRGPSGRFISSILRRSVTFNLRGTRIPRQRIASGIGTTLRLIKLRKCRGHSPSDLSNKRGRQTTLTKILTLGPRVLVFSRTASVLSPGKHQRMLTRVGGLHSYKGAIIVVARSIRRTTLTSHIVLVKYPGKRGSAGAILTRNDTQVVLASYNLLGRTKVLPPVTIQVCRSLGRTKVRLGQYPLAGRRLTRTLYE